MISKFFISLICCFLITYNCTASEVFCSADVNKNGAVDKDELFMKCLSDDNDDCVCPVIKTLCYCPVHRRDAVRCYQGEEPFCENRDAVHESDHCLVSANPDTSCDTGNRVYVNGRWLCRTGDPQCENGIYNAEDGKCYPKGYPCPLGLYPCVTPKGYGHAICSDIVCRKAADTTPGGGYDKTDNGSTDPVTGECLGNLYIFNGYENLCRNSSSAATGFRSCCTKDDYFFGLSDCKETEAALARKRKNGLCVELGERCTKKTGFIFKFCIEKSDIFCCFTSKLARIVHEQMRPKLTDFNETRPFGSAQRPVCRGFTPEEFQAADLNKLDLSEWYQEIETRQQKEAEHQMQDKIRERTH